MSQIHDTRPRTRCLVVRRPAANNSQEGCAKRRELYQRPICGAWPRLATLGCDGALSDALSTNLDLDEPLAAEDSLVVQNALTLWRQFPTDAPLQILDTALAACGDDLEFAFEYEELQPPHPFAELLRLAFDPNLDPTELLLTTVEIEPRDPSLRTRVERARDAWQVVISRFADRYQIWHPFDGESESCSHKHNGRSRQHR